MIWHRVSIPGIALGLLFFAASLTPSLIPKSAALFGLLGGTAMALGYLLAVTLVGVARYLEVPEVPPGIARAVLRGSLLLVGLVGAVWGLSIHRPGQNSIRLLMGMEPVDATHELVVLGLALSLFLLLFLIGRLTAVLTARLSRRIAAVVPPRIAMTVSLVLVAILSWYLSNGVILRWSFNTLDDGLRELDTLIDPNLPAPKSRFRSGSPESLIPWETLGAEGRAFVSGGWQAEELANFHAGQAVQDPIRLYAGLNSAEDATARAQLVLDEMIRTGAFEREIVVLVTPTGTGWIDAAAVDPLEVMFRGDTAIVGVQYSYLMSPLALIFEPDVGPETAKALAWVVQRHWSGLPRETRPKLFLYGLSLGSYGSEQAFSLTSLLGDPVSGALWSGPTYENALWKSLTLNRTADSPVWWPRFGDGNTVRFNIQQSRAMQGVKAENGARIVYLQYPSDPITFFEVASALRPSEWMVEDRAPDVSELIRWYPIISMLQIAVDMLAGTEVPAGFGHLFSAEHYLNAWIELTAPAGWSEADTKRLEAAFR